MHARSLQALITAASVAVTGCFWDESSLFFIPDLLVGAEPASEVWVRIRHPQLPISFELPANYAAPADAGVPWLANPGPLDARKERVETWGIRPTTRGRPLYAIEFVPLVVTESDRLEPSLVRRLSRPRSEPEELMAFFQAACEPKVFELLELSNQRPIVLGACTGVRFRARWTPPSVLTHVHEILVAPVPGQGVLIADAPIYRRATDEERNAIGPRIIGSIKIEPCDWPSPAAGPSSFVE